eukprot:m.302468 g.302468  ORF g.302468 m.302468 type:complete len:101 (+) comp20144_c0_seq10:438-740(+)
MALIIFDSNQNLFQYGSRGIQQTVQKWKATKVVPTENHTNENLRKTIAGEAGPDDEDDGAGVSSNSGTKQQLPLEIPTPAECVIPCFAKSFLVSIIMWMR